MRNYPEPGVNYLKPGIISKKKIIIFVFACVFFTSAMAQNLIPNPGFENYKFVPCSCMQKSMYTFVNNWEQVGAGTPDYIHTLAPENCYANNKSKNKESCGAENPHKGKAMGMIMTHAKDGSYREYVGIRLKRPLEKGKTYYAEFYVSLGDNCGVATNNLGMLFLPGRYVNNNDFIIEGNPQINETKVIDKASGWTKISGTFTPDEDLTYLVVGNFLATDNTIKKQISTLTSTTSTHADHNGMAAYYVDDFMVYDVGNKLVVSKDTVVDSLATVNLFASGGADYEWVDTESPTTVMSEDSKIKFSVDHDRSFWVYSGRDSAKINVRIRKPVQEIMGREVKKSQILEVASDEVLIEIYDKFEVDGDIISLYHDQAMIAEHVTVSKNVVTYKISIDRAKPNHIITFAENEGFSPPNTACIVIRDGDKVTEVVLSSDLTSCDSVILNYKQGN